VIISIVIIALTLPACAVFAGAGTWVMHRGEAVDDYRLLRSYMVFFAIAVVVSYGVIRTDTVRKKIDPAYKMMSDLNKLQADLDAHPVFAALKAASPDEHAKLSQAMMADGAKGMSIPAMLLVARPWLAQLGTRQSGFADAETRVAWAQVTLDTLIEMRRRSPQVCFQVIANLPEGNLALTQGLSASNSKAFEQAFADLMKSIHRGMTNRAATPGVAVEFNEAARQWRTIMDSVKAEYGDAATAIVSGKKFAATPPELQDQVCSARIRQLGLMLDQPVPMASRLVDSALR
jgi:hypothetical protein